MILALAGAICHRNALRALASSSLCRRRREVLASPSFGISCVCPRRAYIPQLVAQLVGLILATHAGPTTGAV